LPPESMSRVGPEYRMSLYNPPPPMRTNRPTVINREARSEPNRLGLGSCSALSAVCSVITSPKGMA
jgi:hypothetical protein